jgi:hypothetical protein
MIFWTSVKDFVERVKLCVALTSSSDTKQPFSNPILRNAIDLSEQGCGDCGCGTSSLS